MFLLKLFRFNFKNIQFIILSPYPWIWSIQFSSVTQSCLTATAWLQHTRLPSPSPIPGAYSNSCPVHHQFPELTRTHVHCISDAIQPSHPLSPPSPPAFNLSQHQRLFQLVSSSTIRWPKYWSFSFSISPSNEYSFRTDWLDLLAVQGTLKSLLQPHSSKASILQCFLSKFNMAYFYLFHERHTFFLRALQMFFR